MKTILLSTEEQLATGATHLVICTHADLTETATATAQTLEPFATAVGNVLELKGMKLVTPFKDSGDNANNTCGLTVGDGGSGNRYLASTEINANGTYVSYAPGTGTRYAYTAAGAFDVTFGAPTTGKTLKAFDTGELHLFVRVTDLAAASVATV